LATLTPQPATDKISNRETNQEKAERTGEERRTVFGWLWNYALLGGAAALLMAIVEMLDVNVTLTPVFESLSERAIFWSYFSLNILGGLVIGFLVGVCVQTGSVLKRSAQRAMARGKSAGVVHRGAAFVGISAISAMVLNQQPEIHGYMIEMIREGEKIEGLGEALLNHERAVSYLLLMSGVVGFALVWLGSRWARRSGRIVRAGWVLGVLVVLGVCYYVDSRFETQLYDGSVHRTMFVMTTALSMSVIGTVFSGNRGVERTEGKKVWLGIAVMVVMGAVGFTFVHFDKDQNLKTQVFYRTTQAKQYFRLAQWVLDYDRDGYSGLLGGGDCDDRRADINPGHREVVGDGVDHNCVGGALSEQDIAEWRQEQSAGHVAADASAKRLNVIYVFIDALRADHLSIYGYGRKTSPNLDKLAEKSAVFENAYTPAPNTFEALPKFTQGTYWDGHIEGWPEIMARNGYNAVLFPRRLSTLKRHIKGMKIAEVERDGTFEGTINGAIEILGKAEKEGPFCAYLYSTDPHRPYRPHEEFQYGATNTDLYDGEISYLDFHLGRLFDWMERTGRMKDTMIVIMADHGESLGERGVYKHSTLLYNEQTHVPMIIYMPGEEARWIKDYVSTIDLGPTMLSAVGLDYPKECAGVSLLPLMRGQPFTHPPIYGEQTNRAQIVRERRQLRERDSGTPSQEAPTVQPEQNVDPEKKKYMIITQDGFKLIYNRDHYTFELFDLKNDRFEVRNLYDVMPEKSKDMKKRLGRFIDVLTVSRPWDADESQYFLGPTGETREAK
jgi:hypothetical protein